MVRTLLAVAYAGYLVAVGFLVWNPDSSAPGGAVVEVADLFARIGLPVGVDGVELLLNVVLFVPLSLLGAFLLGRWGIAWGVVVGLLGTLLIEGVQGAFLPTRTPSARDVLANTGGALLGILLALVVRRVLPAAWADRMAP